MIHTRPSARQILSNEVCSTSGTYVGNLKKNGIHLRDCRRHSNEKLKNSKFSNQNWWSEFKFRHRFLWKLFSFSENPNFGFSTWESQDAPLEDPLGSIQTFSVLLTFPEDSRSSREGSSQQRAPLTKSARKVKYVYHSPPKISKSAPCIRLASTSNLVPHQCQITAIAVSVTIVKGAM